MIYDDMNIYYNYTMKKIPRSQTFEKKLVYSPENEPFLFFYVMNFCKELSKTESIGRVSFT